MPTPLSWLEIDARAIRDNLRLFKDALRPGTRLMAVIKGEAYGHGMIPVARVALHAGADWLGVFHLGEALELRQEGIQAPVLVMGYLPRADVAEAVEQDVRLTVSSLDTLEATSRAARATGRKARLHLKIETGTNIEDTTEHDYARGQLQRFQRALQIMREDGFEVPLPHTACTAAAILFPETIFAMARVGIGLYGMWPSKETQLSALQIGKAPLALKPALTWKTLVAQLKPVPTGAFVGYGCTYRTTRETVLAILPVGYANGYDRMLSNCGHVLVRGMRAPVRGRVCMNLTMVDVTDIPGVALEDEVVLLGAQGDERITAEQMAAWAQTINYEIVTRADPYAPRDFAETPG
jgi:alanine racemase